MIKQSLFENNNQNLDVATYICRPSARDLSGTLLPTSYKNKFDTNGLNGSTSTRVLLELWAHP
jgi:hypothetical protein